MKKAKNGIWKTIQWIIAVILGVAALGAFGESFGAGICWLISAFLICPASRNVLIKAITKKKDSQIHDVLLKKSKGSVNVILCGVLAIVFLCIGSEAMPETQGAIEEVINTEIVNTEHVVEPEVEDSTDISEESTKDAEEIEDSKSIMVESASEEEGTEEVSRSSEEESSENVDVSIVSSLEVHFIDVGQADAALLLCDGETMLIDGGNKGDSNLIYAYLKKLDISYLNYIVATHAHEDHVGGLAGALNYAEVGNVYCPVTVYESDAFSDFKKYVEKRNAQITVPSVGDCFELGNAVVEILGLNAGSEVNDTSIMLKVTHGDISFLFTGDAEREAEQVVLNSGCDLSSTVLKVGHHGSADSTTYPFLREIMPAYVVISVGDDNSYGHPTQEVLSRLRDAEVKVFRTDLQGDIIAVSDGQNVVVNVEKNPDADTLALQVVSKPEPTPEPTLEPTVEEPESPSVQTGKTYVLNTNTKKFHIPSCSSVKDIKPKNYLEYIGTADEVRDMGYVGCKRCNP